MGKGIILLLLLFVTIEDARTGEYAPVASVSHNYSEKLNSALFRHVNWYYNFELAFNAYSSFFNRTDVSLPGFSGFFKKSSKHMRDKAISMTRLINMRGGFFESPKLGVGLNKVCNEIKRELKADRTKPYICRFSEVRTKAHKSKGPSEALEKWLPGLYGLEDALAAERALTFKVYELIKTAKTDKDLHVKHFLEHECLEPERTKSLGDLVKRLRGFRSIDRSAYNIQEYMMDTELSS